MNPLGEEKKKKSPPVELPPRRLYEIVRFLRLPQRKEPEPFPPTIGRRAWAAGMEGRLSVSSVSCGVSVSRSKPSKVSGRV